MMCVTSDKIGRYLRRFTVAENFQAGMQSGRPAAAPMNIAGYPLPNTYILDLLQCAMAGRVCYNYFCQEVRRRLTKMRAHEQYCNHPDCKVSGMLRLLERAYRRRASRIVNGFATNAAAGSPAASGATGSAPVSASAADAAAALTPAGASAADAAAALAPAGASAADAPANASAAGVSAASAANVGALASVACASISAGAHENDLEHDVAKALSGMKHKQWGGHAAAGHAAASDSSSRSAQTSKRVRFTSTGAASTESAQTAKRVRFTSFGAASSTA